MKIKAIIYTAKGSAKELESYLKNPIMQTLLGLKGKKITKLEIYTNDKDRLLLDVECDYKSFLRINKNLNHFDNYMKLVMGKVRKNKMVRKKYNIDEEGDKMLDKLMSKGTKIEIIKDATAQELNEAGKSFWTRMKEKMRRSE